MINKTVSKLYASDYDSFSEALADLNGNSYSEELQIECLDKEMYEEDSLDWTGITFTGSGFIHFIGSFDENGRTSIRNVGLNNHIFKLDQSFEIEGIAFYADQDFDCSTGDYGCIYVDAPNNDSSSIHECQFWGNGRYFYQSSPYAEYGNYAIHWAGSPPGTSPKDIYNNLFRGLGYYAIQFIGRSNTDFYNNTFVKNQEDLICWAVYGGTSVFNNIFIKDGDREYIVDCKKLAAIQCPGGQGLDQFAFWDYNIYQFLNDVSPITHMNLWTKNWQSSTDVERLPEAQSKWPTVEANGYQGDPKFYRYCEDYRIVDPTSPAKSNGYTTIPTIDNDGRPRSGALDIGCYKCLTSVEYYFVGDTDSDWNDADNWASFSGGAGGAGVPGNYDKCVFDSNSPRCDLDVDVVCDEIDCQTGFSNSIYMNSKDITAMNFNVNHMGSIYKNNGGGTITVYNQFVNNGKLFTTNPTDLRSSSLVNNGIVVPIIKNGWQNVPRANDKQLFQSRLQPRASINPY